MAKWTYWRIDAAGALFCIAASLTAYFGALRPLMQRRAALAEQRDELMIHRQKASCLAASAVSLEKQLLSARQALADSKFTLEPPGHVNRKIAQLTELVGECGLKMDNIQMGKAFKGRKFAKVPISLAGFGRYNACALFLHGLSGGLPDMAVGSFEISGNPQKPDEDGTFRFGLFWYAAPKIRPSQK